MRERLRVHLGDRKCMTFHTTGIACIASSLVESIFGRIRLETGSVLLWNGSSRINFRWDISWRRNLHQELEAVIITPFFNGKLPRQPNLTSL